MSPAVEPGATSRLERLTTRWWLYVVLLLLFFVPSYAERPFDPRHTSALVTAVLSQALSVRLAAFYPLFKVAPLLLLAALLLGRGQPWRTHVWRAFAAYAALNLLLATSLGNAAQTAAYGLAVLTGNVVVYTTVAALWAWEALHPRTDVSPRPIALWRCWVAPLALLAFWMPADLQGSTVTVTWHPALLFSNSAGLALCMVTPGYLAALTLFYPTVNLPVLRVTAFAALVTGLLNMVQWFGAQPENWWMGVLHLPMVLIALYALVLGWRRTPAAAGEVAAVPETLAFP